MLRFIHDLKQRVLQALQDNARAAARLVGGAPLSLRPQRFQADTRFPRIRATGVNQTEGD